MSILEQSLGPRVGRPWETRGPAGRTTRLEHGISGERGHWPLILIGLEISDRMQKGMSEPLEGPESQGKLHAEIHTSLRDDGPCQF